MVDQNLGGDDLKLVRFKILYTKRDHEKILVNGDYLINYSTTLDDFGGRITCIEIPKWEKANPKEAPLDSRFVQTFVEVLARYPKQEKEYDREQVAVLRDIKDLIAAKV
jgi:hypothetical protein